MQKENNAQKVSLFPEQDAPFAVQCTPQNMMYKVNIDEEFTHPRQFNEIVDILDNANEGDYLHVNLTTVGGALHAILPMLGAMQASSCHVHVHACSDVASAGTFLLMRAQSVSMNDYVTVMFHNVSFGSNGPGNTVATHVAHTLKSSERLLRDMYADFFEKDELEKMLSGTDYYMGRDEFVERYERRMEINKAREDRQMKAAIKASRPPRKPKAAKNAITEKDVAEAIATMKAA